MVNDWNNLIGVMVSAHTVNFSRTSYCKKRDGTIMKSDASGSIILLVSKVKVK